MNKQSKYPRHKDDLYISPSGVVPPLLAAVPELHEAKICEPAAGKHMTFEEYLETKCVGLPRPPVRFSNYPLFENKLPREEYTHTVPSLGGEEVQLFSFDMQPGFPLKLHSKSFGWHSVIAYRLFEHFMVPLTCDCELNERLWCCCFSQPDWALAGWSLRHKSKASLNSAYGSLQMQQDESIEEATERLRERVWDWALPLLRSWHRQFLKALEEELK